MSFFSDLLATVLERRPRLPALTAIDSLTIDDLAVNLLSAPGEEASLKIARRIFGLYEAMDDDAKLAFFTMLAVKMNISPQDVRSALERYEASADRASYRAFMAAVDPPRQEFMRRLNQVSGGSGALVKMRADRTKPRAVQRNQNSVGVLRDKIFVLGCRTSHGLGSRHDKSTLRHNVQAPCVVIGPVSHRP